MPVISSVKNKKILEHCERVSSNNTELTISTITKGSISIESMYDEEVGAIGILREVQKAQDEGADGVIIYCFGNPAIEAAKELADIPVIGIGEAAQTIALPLCESYGIISTVQNSVARNMRKAKILGTYEKLGSVIPLNMKVTELTDHSDDLVERICELLQREIKNKGLDLLIQGCGYLIGLSGKISEKLRVPVIDSGLAAIKLMETYVSLNIRQSKRSYMKPPEKERRFC